ncbi:hypothetical protein C8F04DRAFT_1192653 [Mycena alexandri]|uniref:Myb/SANT-like domain-containing protein n=1 Tax=Mycena alexandri TaxID=1745969 RepID=A0AAD6WWZ0_9AGAR|nr:hypothetical protein C8F04DRAFT_1192653 [Mycena alexandri]
MTPLQSRLYLVIYTSGMPSRGEACDWTFDPTDKTALVVYFKTIKDKIGQGGSWDQTSLESAAAHMAERGPPLKGAPKTANSIKGVWAGMKKIHDALVLVLAKRYPGASGWTYDQDKGFSITHDSRTEWNAFVKQHSVFKPFATRGWDLFDDVKDILPTCARGVHVFNAAIPPATPSQVIDDASQSQQLHLPSDDFDYNDPPSPSQLLDTSQSQPFSDYWFQTQSQISQPISNQSQTQSQPSQLVGDWSHLAPPPQHHLPALPLGPVPVTPATVATPATAARPAVPLPAVALQTPAGGVKRAASDELQTPWTAKKGKTSGPDALLAIGGSVERVSDAIRECFKPQKSSAVSLTKQIERARQLAIEDQELGTLTPRERATLNLIFSKDSRAADAYVAERTAADRAQLAEILIERF